MTQRKDSQPGKWSRRERRQLARQFSSKDPGLSVVHPNAAGIDIGNEEHFVAVPPERSQNPVRRFGCFTEDLLRMAEWLRECGITTVAMQSTGVYWIAVYDVLEAAGLEVYLVNAQHTKNLPGRKSDVQESQWLMKLHTYGLLNNSFRPVSTIRVLRCYWRQRSEHIQAASSSIQRMQKALTEMNLQLSNVISDISGLTGMRILRAIVAGERDREKLAAMRHPRVHASKAEIARSLEGNWRDELLFVLGQELDSYDTYQRKIAECDREIEKHLAGFKTQPRAHSETVGVSAEPDRSTRPKQRKGNAPEFGLASELVRITGVDLTRIDGVDVMVAQTVISEVGLDMSRWKTEAHFASWLGLCPNHDISGGKVIKKGKKKVVNRAATALRMGASTLIRSKSYLGAQYRRLRSRLGAPKAIKAMAHRLARLIYRMLRYGQEYVDRGMAHYEAKYRENQIRHLAKNAADLGFQLVENTAVV